MGETSIEKEKIEKQITELIKGRLRIIKRDLASIEGEINYFSKKYTLTNEDFLSKFEGGTLGDDEDYFIWKGVINMKNALLEEQTLLREAL